MSDLEPTVTFKPSDNQVSIAEINEIDKQASASNSIEDQEIRDKIEPIRASK